MVFYDDNVSLTKNTTITNSGAKFIITFFNDNTQEVLYIIAIYKPPKIQVSHFNSILERHYTKNAFILSTCNNWKFQYKLFNQKKINHQHYKHS